MAQTDPPKADPPRENEDDNSDDEFHDARFPAEEEAKLLEESNACKDQANKQFAAAAYSDAISTYDRALASCPNYLDYEIAVLKSNISACYLKLQDWKAAVDSATASIDCLDRCLPKPKKAEDGDANSGSESKEGAVVELSGDDEEEETKQLEQLQQDDARRQAVKRIRAKALMRRARAKTELGGWANLQGAEEDYKELAAMDNLPPSDQKIVQKSLRELPARIQVAREKEMGEMMGKLKDLGNGILKPFGLSTDNFQFTKDEATGGYSMQFNQADAELVATRAAEEGILDATKYGPTTVHPPMGCDIEQGAIQKTLPKKDLTQSDTECLNLDIAVPETSTSTSKLPVLLFIHGGGLVIGANSWPQFDWTRIIKLSIEKEVPVVAVGINYRLGAFGYLTSEELRSAGYKANNGLRDQRVSIDWVHRHIRDFSGDPENITLAGMSAGGASALQLLHFNTSTPLCKRVLSMSGTNLLISPMSLAVHEQGYKAAIQAWGLEGLSPEDRFKAILDTPASELVAKLPPSLPIGLAADGDAISTPPSFAGISDRSSSGYLQGSSWCEEILIGDAQHDTSIFAYTMAHQSKDCASRFTTALQGALSTHPSDVVSHILEAYGLSATTPDTEAWPRVLEFLNDVHFHAAVLAYASGWPEDGTAYVYYFNETNPFDGPFKGQSTHILDLAYFFQNYNEFLTPDQQEVARAFAEDLLRFVSGKVPWGSCVGVGKGFSARVFGPSSQKQIRRMANEAYGGESQRRSVLQLLVQEKGVKWDELAIVFPVFVGSYSP
ncbi:hypothetical protein PISL3812_01267 [Talaromyces islandicus]|uniref:Carboxylesterase type B domain-containing protein n=1 Tax=Talaromyces islandicus TaxID=28573 RepID=A0A0U1LP33_TALIS|nr:hypothetical protein PISL3812_01267 [Talaromyces islandicus]